MAGSITCCSRSLTALSQCDVQQTTLPAEIWSKIFFYVSESPGQSLARLATVCSGWQREIEPLSFSDIVVRPTDDDLAILRRISSDSRRSRILSKITFCGPSPTNILQRARELKSPNSTSINICKILGCLATAAQENLHRPLTLTFAGWDDPRGSVNTVQDSNLVAQNLGAQDPSHCRIEQIILALEKQQWASTMFADMVKFCSPGLKTINLGLVAKDKEDAEYNTSFMRALQRSLRNTNLEELNTIYPSSVLHQEIHPYSYSYMMASFVNISRNLQVFKVKDAAADMFFDLASRTEWPNLHTFEIHSSTLGGTATTFFQDDYLENAVTLVTTVSKAVSRMKELKRLVLKQRLWLYYDDVWDLDCWAWLDIDFNVLVSQRRTEATTAKLSIRGVEPEDAAIEAWHSAIAEDRGIPLDCRVGWNVHQKNPRIRRIMKGGW